MTTILGEKIDVIRPRKITLPQRTNNWKVKYHCRPKTILKGRVREIVVKVKCGAVFGLTCGTHLDVLSAFHLNPEEIEATGWILDGGKEIWR